MNKKLTLLSIFLLISLITLKLYFSGTDLSFYPVKNANKIYSKEKIWLISYASDNIHIQNQSNLVMSANMYQVFDVIIPYQPHNIEPEYYKKHQAILSQKRGAGYWLWKPYLILKTLNMMQENDILLYSDSSVVFRDGIYELLALAKKHNVVLFPNFHSNRGYMKKAIIDKISNGDQSLIDKPHLEGTFILLRNNPQTKKFVEEWLKYSEDPELLTDLPSKDEYPDFIDSRHDQSILSAIYYKSPGSYRLYNPYPARMKAMIVTRRKTQCSLKPITFGNSSEFGWIDRIKYRSIIWLIGCQIFKGH
jgi:hypothetical protein